MSFLFTKQGMVKTRKKLYTQQEQIFDLLEPRLDKIGEITLAEVWKTIRYPYSDVARVFKRTLDAMVELKKAEMIVKGRYIIKKPNTPQYLRKKAA